MSSDIAVNFTSIWSIKYETFMATKILKSPKFQTAIPGVEYSFTIEHGNDGYIGIYLNEIEKNGPYKFYPERIYVSSAPEYHGNLTIGHEVRSKYFKSYKNCVVITKKYLLESEYTLFHEGFMHLNFNGTFIIDLDDADKTENSNSSLGNFLWNDSDKDFTLITDRKKIKVHKFILRRFSPGFGRIFNQKNKEKPLSTQLIITDFEYETVEAAVKLCYDQNFDQFEDDVPSYNFLLELLRFFGKYDMHTFKDKIELQLCQLISKENVCKLANKSIELNAAKLRAFCVNFLSNCITSEKPFDNASNLMDEMALEVFKKCQCQTFTS